jgi:hypothetical protein
MEPAAQAAVDAGDDVFLADDFSEPDDAIGCQLRVLDEIGGMADNTRNRDLPDGQFHVAPDLSSCSCRDVARFKNVSRARTRSAASRTDFSDLSADWAGIQNPKPVPSIDSGQALSNAEGSRIQD